MKASYLIFLNVATLGITVLSMPWVFYNITILGVMAALTYVGAAERKKGN